MRDIFISFMLIALAGFGVQTHRENLSVNSLTIPAKTTQATTIDPTTKNTPSPSYVIRVIDGDTIIIETNGLQEKVRLIGVDTPESVDPRRKIECFGKESSRFTKLLLLNKEVRLENDSSQGDRDKYGRLLRFVFLPDDTLANSIIIAEGYGYEYTHKTPHRYQHDFKTKESKAKSQKKGLWAQGACTKTK